MDATLIAVIEMSQSSWLVGGIVARNCATYVSHHRPVAWPFGAPDHNIALNGRNGNSNHGDLSPN
jgi:hypothetical protein